MKMMQVFIFSGYFDGNIKGYFRKKCSTYVSGIIIKNSVDASYINIKLKF